MFFWAPPDQPYLEASIGREEAGREVAEQRTSPVSGSAKTRCPDGLVRGGVDVGGVGVEVQFAGGGHPLVVVRLAVPHDVGRAVFPRLEDGFFRPGATLM